MEDLGKWPIVGGTIVVAIGAVLWLGGDRLGWIGRLPGDIRIERDNFRFYFPIATLILINLLIWLAWWVVRRFF